jgi:hypothetical protein
VAHNRRREQRDVRLFELGNVFSKARGERQSLALAWTGGSDVPHWSGACPDVTFFDMKGALDRVWRALNLQPAAAPHTEEWLVRDRPPHSCPATTHRRLRAVVQDAGRAARASGRRRRVRGRGRSRRRGARHRRAATCA